MTEWNQKQIAKLLKMAAYIISTPDLPDVYASTICDRIDVYGCSTPAEVIRKFGAMDKVVSESHPNLFILRKKEDGFVVEFNFNRNDVCRQVKVGEKVLPAEPAKTINIEAKPERVEPIYEWQCPDSLLRPKDHADVLQSASEAVADATAPATTPVVTMTDDQVRACEEHQAHLDSQEEPGKEAHTGTTDAW